MTWTSQEITLVDNTNEYQLNSKFVSVESVEFALDGSTYERPLKACTLEDLDAISAKWRYDTGQEPTRYALLSTPGLQYVISGVSGGQGARIVIHRMLAVASPSKIRVSGWGIGTTSATIPDDVQERVHVPYCMAVLRGEHDPKEAAWFYQQFVKGCDELKGRFVQPYQDAPSGVSSWL